MYSRTVATKKENEHYNNLCDSALMVSFRGFYGYGDCLTQMFGKICGEES